jgi:hypothetical protein
MGKFTIQTTLRALSVAYYLEALVLYITTVAIIWAMATSPTKALLTDSALLILTLGAAIWLTFAGRAILRGKRWARSAGIFWQLIQLAIASETFEASLLYGYAIAIPSLAVLFTLFTKTVVKATSEIR